MMWTCTCRVIQQQFEWKMWHFWGWGGMGQNILWPFYIFSGGQNPQTPVIYAPASKNWLDFCVDPAHVELGLRLGGGLFISTGRNPGISWKRLPGRPRKTWTSQIPDDTGMSSRAYWDAAIRCGHGRGTLRSLKTTRWWWWWWWWRRFALSECSSCCYLRQVRGVFVANVDAIVQQFTWIYLFPPSTRICFIWIIISFHPDGYHNEAFFCLLSLLTG